MSFHVRCVAAPHQPAVLWCALLAALPLLVSTGAHAQATAGSTTARVLPEVVVRDSAWSLIPQPAAVRGEADLAARRASTSDTAQLLGDVPGVSWFGAGGVSSLPVIRGLADDRLRVLVDGVDAMASCPNHMNSPLSYIDPAQVGRIEVLAGITPVSAGGDSIGGTVSVESTPPRFAAPGEAPSVRGEAGLTVRSFGGRAGHASASYATEQFALSASTAMAQADNYQAGGNFRTATATGRVGHPLPLDEVGSTAYSTRNHQLGVAYKGGRHLVEAKLSTQDLPYQLYPNQRMDMLDNQMHRFSLRYLGETDWGSIEARAYRESVDHFMDFGADKRYWYGTATGGSAAADGKPCAPLSATCAAGMPMYTASTTTGASLKAEVRSQPDSVWRTGLELQRYRLNDWWPASGGGMWPGTFANVKDGERDRTGVYAEWEARHGAQWMTLVGLRHDHVQMTAGNVQGYNPAGGGNQGRDAAAFNALNRNRSDGNWDFTALARHQTHATLDVEFGFARKTRSPNLYETYPWSTWQMAALMNNFVGDGNGYVGNPALKPEVAHTLSATADWHSADRSSWLKVTPYLTEVQDYIDAQQWNATANAPQTQRVQRQFTVLRYTNQRARLHGVDVSGAMPLMQNDWGRWGVSGVLSHTRGENRTTGDNLYQVMPLNAKLVLTQQHNQWSQALEWVGVSAKTRVSAVRNEVATPGYSLLNWRGSYTMGNVRFDFGVQNLLNRMYYLPQGGAYTGQGTTMTTMGASVPAWGVAVPGPGRSLYAGVNVKF